MEGYDELEGRQAELGSGTEREANFGSARWGGVGQIGGRQQKSVRQAVVTAVTRRGKVKSQPHYSQQ